MNKKWYVINVYSGFEKKVSESIRQQASKKDLSDKFGDIIVPSEEILEIRHNEKIKTEKNYFPGYILTHMELTDETWHLVRKIPKVSGFLGIRGKPSSISELEVKRILNQIKESIEHPMDSIRFEVGEQVRVSDGPFSSFNGIVEEVDSEKARLKVSVMIFGRPTPVDLEFTQVEKI